MFLGAYFSGAQAHRLAQADPGFDAAFAAGGAIVVMNTLHPFAADIPVPAVGEDGGVLHRNIHLIVIPVRHPALDLPAAGAALIHGHVVRMMDVVVTALVAQRLFELGAAQGQGGGLLAHNRIAIPS